MTEVAPTTTTGSLGEMIAGTKFLRLGWAPPVKIPQDIGDDLMTFARDRSVNEGATATYDLSAPVFMQVKGSPTAYREPSDNDQGTDGWWFYESDTDHFDHWLMFGLPYFLVLVDTSAEIAYWTHVEGSRIVSTGRGRKIFVPSEQRVDDTSLKALNEVAVQHRTMPLEGNVWNGSFESLTPGARLRNALIMPRLIAPHPNRPAGEQISYEQAVAMVLRNRSGDLLDASEKGLCPAPDAWSGHRQWGWRFVATLHALIADEDRTGLEALTAANGPRPLAFERDACDVVRACSAHAAGQTGEALRMLKVQPDSKVADKGWILAQRAHMLFELNQPKAAAQSAQSALIAIRSLDGDLSISAIRGGCAEILYASADMGTGDLESTIAAQDNAVSWWRAQDASHTLSKALGDRFTDWSQDGSITVRAVDPSDQLRAAALNAAISAHWSNWRHLSFLMAQLSVTTTSDLAHCTEALALLVQTGQKKAAKAAARRFWVAGPLEALTEATTFVAGNDWSRRSEGAAMAVLAHGGDLLSPELADKSVTRILDVLRTEGAVRQHGHNWADRWHEIGSALARLLHAATLDSHRRCLELVLSSFTESLSRAQASVQIAKSLDLRGMGEEECTKICNLSLQRHDSYRYELLVSLAPHFPEAMELLRKLATTGDNEAILALLSVDPSEERYYYQLGLASGTAVQRALKAASGVDGNFVYSYGGNDHLRDLTVSALRTDDKAFWDQVLAALDAGTLPVDQVIGTIELISTKFDSLDEGIKERLGEIASSMSAAVPLEANGCRFQGAVIALQLVSSSATDFEVLTKLLRFQRDDTSTFARLLRFWKSPHRLSLLTILAADQDPQVRAIATSDLINSVDQYDGQQEAVSNLVLTALNLSEGSLAHIAAASSLTTSSHQSLRKIRDFLTEHPSAIVRKQVEQSSGAEHR